MITTNMIYGHVWASLVKFVQDFNTAQAPLMPSFVNWDAHAEINTLPAGDVVGIGNLGVSTVDKEFHIEIGFGISTLPADDTNLFRMIGYVKRLFALLQPEMQIPLVHEDTGEQLGVMIIVGDSDVLPTAKTQTRPVQFIMISLVATVTQGS